MLNSLINSAIIVALLSGMIAVILVTSIRKDIRKYNTLDFINDHDDGGWKLVHGDVFRTPRYSLLLSVLVGNGVQLVAMFWTALRNLFVLISIFCGYSLFNFGVCVSG